MHFFSKMVSITVLYLFPYSAFADCPLDSKEPRFNCTSYEVVLPLNISNSIGGPSLTVMDGSVGIGTLSPLATLDIKSEGTNPTESQLILRNSNSDTNSAVTIHSYSAEEWRGSEYYIKDGQGTIYGVSTADATGTQTERIRISADGNVSINGTIRAETICDQSGANCKNISDGWGSGGGGGSGTVTSITAGTGLTGGTITTSGTIAVDTGTTAGKVVQLDGAGALPAVSAAHLTNVNATALAGKSISPSSPSAGQFLNFDGTSWTNKTLNTSDVSGLNTALGSKLDAANMPSNCAANQTLTFTSPTGNWTCSNISVTPAAFGTQSAGRVLAAPANSSGTPTFRTLTMADLPSAVTENQWSGSGNNVYRSSGNVGIGVANPSSTLDVDGLITSSQSDTWFNITANQYSNSKWASLRLMRARGTAGSPSHLSSGDTIGEVSFRSLLHSSQGSTISSVASENHASGSFGSELRFATIPNGASGPNTRMTISQGGHVGIATTTPSERLHIVGRLRVQGSTDCTLGNGSGGTNCSSDIRLKTNIRPIANSLEKILALRGVEFDWNHQSQSPGLHGIGVIAQDVEKEFPTAVIEDSHTGYKKVDYAVLVAPMIQAMKELQADNDQKAKELEALKARLNEIEKRLK